MTAGDLVVDVQGLTKRFGDTVAVNDLSIQIPRGEIFGFLGPNGSGKTTSIRMLCGLLTPDAGSGQCLGFDIRTESPKIKAHVGYMTQRFSFYEDLSIEENLAFVARIYGVRNVRDAVQETLQRLGLEQRRRQLAGALSGGWKQRLALAACLLHEPRLLLLDEPTAGVDPKARREFWEQVHGLSSRGITVLISTHYMDEAERCTRLAYIAYGRLLAEGTPNDLIARSHLATWRVSDGDVEALATRLKAVPGVSQVVPFGRELHVSGPRSAELSERLEPVLRDMRVHWERDRPRLEDVFIHLMSESGQGP